MKTDRKIVEGKMLETVRERQRELYSNELGFINYAENIDIKIENIKGGLYAKIGIQSVLFVWKEYYINLDINFKKYIKA